MVGASLIFIDGTHCVACRMAQSEVEGLSSIGMCSRVAKELALKCEGTGALDEGDASVLEGVRRECGLTTVTHPLGRCRSGSWG